MKVYLQTPKVPLPVSIDKACPDGFTYQTMGPLWMDGCVSDVRSLIEALQRMTREYGGTLDLSMRRLTPQDRDELCKKLARELGGHEL